MKDWSRRDFIRNTTAVVSAAALWRSGDGRAAAPKKVKRPRALVQILLQGGIDAILTTSPRIKREIDAKVSLSYDESQIHTVGNVRLGPLMEPLLHYVPEMVILNGVQSSTVAHSTGCFQTQQMRRIYPPN